MSIACLDPWLKSNISFIHTLSCLFQVSHIHIVFSSLLQLANHVATFTYPHLLMIVFTQPLCQFIRSDWPMWFFHFAMWPVYSIVQAKLSLWLTYNYWFNSLWPNYKNECG
jgi:hypothetical protein